jgi:hypothetical protein
VASDEWLAARAVCPGRPGKNCRIELAPIVCFHDVRPDFYSFVLSIRNVESLPLYRLRTVCEASLAHKQRQPFGFAQDLRQAAALRRSRLRSRASGAAEVGRKWPRLTLISFFDGGNGTRVIGPGLGGGNFVRGKVLVGMVKIFHRLPEAWALLLSRSRQPLVGRNFEVHQAGLETPGADRAVDDSYH